MPQREETAIWAQGRWHAILREHGIADTFMTGKHGPCPLCGGEDRFRFDDKESRGTYYCNSCGAGDGFDLLQKYMGWDFKTAAASVDRMRGTSIPKETFKEPTDYERRRRHLNEVWSGAEAPFVLHKYLVNDRGLPAEMVERLSPRDIRGHDRLALWDGPEREGYFPSVVCLVRNIGGHPVSVHRTYLSEPRQKKLMPGMEGLSGAAIRLTAGQKIMVAGEGIETTLAGWTYLRQNIDWLSDVDIGAWAGISANGLKEMFFPPTLEHLFICLDADESYTGHAAAFELARRAKSVKGTKVTVLAPTMMGCDMLDVYKQDEVMMI